MSKNAKGHSSKSVGGKDLTRQEFLPASIAGAVAIANTDGAGNAETHLAIEQAHRAVGELLA